MSDESGGYIPRRFVQLARRFVRERVTGSVSIEFKQGRIMGCRANTFDPLEPGPTWTMLEETPEPVPPGVYRVDEDGRLHPMENEDQPKGRRERVTA